MNHIGVSSYNLLNEMDNMYDNVFNVLRNQHERMPLLYPFPLDNDINNGITIYHNDNNVGEIGRAHI